MMRNSSDKSNMDKMENFRENGAQTEVTESERDMFISEAVRGTLLDVPSGLHEAVMGRVRADIAEKAAKRRRMMKVVRRWTAVAAALAVFTGVIIYAATFGLSDAAKANDEAYNANGYFHNDKPSAGEGHNFDANYGNAYGPQEPAMDGDMNEPSYPGEGNSPESDENGLAYKYYLKYVEYGDGKYNCGYVFIADADTDTDAIKELADKLGAAFDGSALIADFTEENMHTVKEALGSTVPHGEFSSNTYEASRPCIIVGLCDADIE